jgi:hypothetical protein
MLNDYRPTTPKSEYITKTEYANNQRRNTKVIDTSQTYNKNKDLIER